MNLNNKYSRYVYIKFIGLYVLFLKDYVVIKRLLPFLTMCLSFILYNFYFAEIVYCQSPDNQDTEFNDQSNQHDYSKFSIFYKSFKDKAKRRLFWHVWKEHTNKYDSYKDFKQVWNSNINIRQEIKKDLRDEFEGFVRFKNTFIWILRRRNPRR